MDIEKGNGSAYIRYWHHCLVDASQLDLSKNTPFSVTREDMLKGTVTNKETLQSLLDFASKKEEQAARYNRGNQTDNTDPIKIVIAYAMLTPEHVHGNRQKDRSVSLLSLPAVIDRETGELTPDGAPFIYRDILEPSGQSQGSDTLLIGDIADVDSYLSEHYDDDLKQWDDFITFSSGLLSKVTNTESTPEKLALSFDGYTISAHVEMRYNDGISGAILHLNNLYKSLQKEKKLGKLLETITSSHDRPRRSDDEQSVTLSKRHTGSMANDHPNSERQRIAIHHALNDTDGAVLAVNGPPGTGKTTLLQGVVASYWVNAALDRQGRPPLIVASSTNNLAVTNIIDSFTNALKDPNLYWRSDDNKSLGLYLCSKSSAERVAKESFIYGAGGKSQLDNEAKLKLSGSFDQHIQKKDNIKKETALFLEKSGCATLKKSIDKLHKELTTQHTDYLAFLREVETRCQVTGITLKDTFDEIKVKSRALDEKRRGVQSKLSALQALDKKLKEAAVNVPFWMGILFFIPMIREQRRYLLLQAFDDASPLNERELNAFTGKDYEKLDNVSAVLKEISKRIKQLQEDLVVIMTPISSFIALTGLFPNSKGTESLLDAVNKKCDCDLRYAMFTTALRYWTGRFLDEANSLGDNPENNKTIWTRYAMMTPCFVSTLHSLPGFFGKANQWNGNKERAVIDLLIIDEAGQVSPEVGATAFAMAKKALVVGDIKQIEPVWGVNAMSDQGNFQSVGLTHYNDHTLTGMLSSNGSIMKMALNSCHLETVINGQEQKGLMLTDHYRCQEDIIRYCNELAYDGLLIPKTTHADLKQPKMAYVNCPSLSSSSNGSRINLGAAEAAIQWVLDNKDFIVSEYGNDSNVESLVAIVTPFKAMATEVIKVASQQGIAVGKKGMTIGTVHSLQGAEREIVLFLPTYGGSKDASMSFINRGVNMLNVAVSRAKKHFVVIGDMALFEKGEKALPSTLLYEHLSPWEKV